MSKNFKTTLASSLKSRQIQSVFRVRAKMTKEDREQDKTNSRFFRKIQKTSSGCWFWLGRKCRQGYGSFRLNGKIEKAHRASYILNWKLEKIPDGVYVCHTCDNPSCVNPEHLFLGTAKENMQDCKSKGRLMSPARIAAQTRGEERYNAKLTEADAIKVHEMFSAGISKAEIARHFRVSYSCTNNIILGVSWKHLIVKGVLK